MKIAFVVQRYGAEIAGGSEAECREYAERLAGRHDVSVLTTCAADYITWANVFPAGLSSLNGVRVHRFPVARRRSLTRFADLSDTVFGAAGTPEEEEAWFAANGPDSPALLAHLREDGARYDVVAFMTYRYAPSYFGLPLVADRAVLIPTAEEDAAITLRVLKSFFSRPAGFLFNTPEEQALVELSAGRALAPATTPGLGVDPPPARSDRSALADLGLPDDFVLYLGRVDRNKGADVLAQTFLDHLGASGRPTTLVYAGPLALTLPSHPSIRSLGFVSPTVRDALLDHARALIVPSPYESLSIVLLEAWNRSRPALVNGACQVLQGQVRRANGGLYYRSPREFSEALTWLLDHPAEADTMGRQGQAYVEREYRWPLVMARVESLLEQVATRASQSV